VEDNELNQQVATGLLDMGAFQVDVANNGKEALDKVHKTPVDRAYDLVLMDVQMPVMDGIEATRQLRAEHFAPPIIALTANVMQGERERYLEVGMNDHLAKPIEPDKLWTMLCRWIKPRRGLGKGVAMNDVTPTTGQNDEDNFSGIHGLDAEGGLRRVLNKVALYRKLLEKFVHDHADDPEKIREAIGDRTLFVRLSHTLKGVASNIGAEEVRVAAAKLEARGKEAADEKMSADGDDVRQLLVELESCHAPLIKRLDAVLTRKSDEAAAEASAPVDMTRLQPVIQRLTAMLEDNDSEAGDLLQTEHQLLQQGLREAFGDLKQAIEHFDFDKALEILRAPHE
jgi:CheY-like chemotaxis protein